MKALISLMTVLAATVAFAGTDIQAMSWGEILSDSSLRTGNSLVFQNGPGLGATYKSPVAADVCHDGTYIYGGTTNIQVCSGSDNNSNCKWQSVKLKTPYQYQITTQVCKGGDDSDCDWVQKTVTQTPNQRVSVFKNKGKGDLQFLGKKAYTIPFCADLSPVPAN